MKKTLKGFVLALSFLLLFAACNDQFQLEVGGSEDTVSRGTGEVTRKWNFQASATGLSDYSTNGNKTVTANVTYLDNMTIRGADANFRWVPTQASPGTGASAGCIQTTSSVTGGKYFVTIASVKGPFTITLYYTDTGSGNSGRYPVIYTNGTQRAQGTATSGLTLRTYSYSYTGTDTVTVQLGCNNPIRLFDVVIASKVPATSVAISPSGNFSIAVNATRQLSATTSPADATNDVTWSSSNTSIATVSSAGLVTGKAAGTATITATDKDTTSVKASVTATITAASSGGSTTTTTTPSTGTNWNFSKAGSLTDAMNYTTNGSATVKTDVAYTNGMTLLGSQRDFRWIPSQSAPTPANANVNAGCIQVGGSTSSGKYFLKIDNVKGPFKITLYYTGTGSGQSGRYPVIYINGSSVKNGAGTTNADLTIADYSYTGTSTVTVQLGCNNAIRLYNVLLEGSTSGGSTTTTTPSTPSDVKVTGITLSSGNFSNTVGQTRTLTATIAPSTATNKNVTWSSSSTSVATVSSSGVVTAVAAGTATITATAADGSGVKASVTATITAATSSGSTGSGSTGSTGSGTTGGTITKSQGWLESAFIEFSGSGTFNVEYQKSGASTWTKIDSQLIRNYGSNKMRADIVGLSAGTYSIRVAASGSTSYSTSTGISVQSHIRSGFAFSSNSPNKNSNGAYNSDGTLKSGAQVVYLTGSNAKTVTLDVKESASKTTTGVGIGKILSLRQKGYDTTPLSIRIVGRINEADISDQLGSNYLLQVKGKSSSTLSNITIEGIGNDAVCYGWGILVRNSFNVEVRNIGFMMFPEDAVSLDTDNQNIWVHNNDFFYGKDGGGDKNKGDGALDSKKSGYVTFSFNHFWDSGKCNLLGNGTEPEEKLTYHHNWYDHSDSRHPRVRFHSAHVVNNFYDGVAKYGVGATCGSSIYVQNNYFLNTKNPMLISMQGTDIKSGNGTFSSENGGIIKSSGNTFDGSTAGVAWSSNNVEFDFWEGTGTVPNTVKTKKGGFTYNNFDTNLGYSFPLETPANARTRVTTYAGRMQGRSGSDFTWWGWTTADNTADARNSALDSAVKNYAGKRF